MTKYQNSPAHTIAQGLFLQLFFYFEHLNFNESHYFLVINDKSLAALRLQGFFVSGARYRTRTCDPMHVKHVLYQLS